MCRTINLYDNKITSNSMKFMSSHWRRVALLSPELSILFKNAWIYSLIYSSNNYLVSLAIRISTFPPNSQNLQNNNYFCSLFECLSESWNGISKRRSFNALWTCRHQTKELENRWHYHFYRLRKSGFALALASAIHILPAFSQIA